MLPKETYTELDREISMGILLSGLIGALLVFFLQWGREWRRNERARRGLLRLLSSEIEHNAVVVETIQDSGRTLTFSREEASRMTTEAWRASRQSVATLPPGVLEALDGYYRPLEVLLTLLAFSNIGEERMERGIRKMLSETLEREFVRSSDPWGDYERAMLEAQEHAGRQIADYLACPWWSPAFLRADEWLRRQRQMPHQSHEDRS